MNVGSFTFKQKWVHSLGPVFQLAFLFYNAWPSFLSVYKLLQHSFYRYVGLYSVDYFICYSNNPVLLNI